MMKQTNPSTRLLSTLAMFLWVVSLAHAQGKPPAAAPLAPAKAKRAPAKAQRQAKPVGRAASKPGAPAPKPEAGVKEAAVRTTEIRGRDPFQPLIRQGFAGTNMPDRLPPGKAGLVISTLRIEGLVRGPNGMIAVVSNPQQRVYFIREADQLYDGAVYRISLDQVSFAERTKDAFGRPIERTVVKRLYPIVGEQQ